jgi:hypothetical protein
MKRNHLSTAAAIFAAGVADLPSSRSTAAQNQTLGSRGTLRHAVRP